MAWRWRGYVSIASRGLPWYGMRRWGPRRWRPTADSTTLAHAIHKRRMRQRAARIMSAMGLRVIPPRGGAVLPVTVVTGDNLGQRAFPEILGMPTGIFGKFEGEVVHTGGGSYIWRLSQWEPYIYPG